MPGTKPENTNKDKLTSIVELTLVQSPLFPSLLPQPTIMASDGYVFVSISKNRLALLPAITCVGSDLSTTTLRHRNKEIAWELGLLFNPNIYFLITFSSLKARVMVKQKKKRRHKQVTTWL